MENKFVLYQNIIINEHYYFKIGIKSIYKRKRNSILKSEQEEMFINRIEI